MSSTLSIQEKRPLAFGAIDLLVFSTYQILLYQRSGAEYYSEPYFWAVAILILVPLMIVSRILLYIVFSITNTIVTRQQEEKFRNDELGSIVKLKANRVFTNIYLIGFLISISLLLFDFTLSGMFNGFLFSIYAAFIAQHIAQFYYLRKGTSL